MSIVGTNDMPVVWRRVEQAAGCELARGSEETETCLCGPTLWLDVPSVESLFCYMGTVMDPQFSWDNVVVCEQ